MFFQSNLKTFQLFFCRFQMVNSNAASITQKTTFGWHRIEVVGALSSLVFLGSLSFGTAIEAMQVIISCLIKHRGQETQKITAIMI